MIQRCSIDLRGSSFLVRKTLFPSRISFLHEHVINMALEAESIHVRWIRVRCSIDEAGSGGGLEEDWSRIGGGLDEDWRRTGGGLEDWRRIGGGLEIDVR